MQFSSKRRRRRAVVFLCLSAIAVPVASFTVSSPLRLPRHKLRNAQQVRNRQQHIPLYASASVPNIAVALDQPLLTDAGNLFPYERSSRFIGGGVIMRWISSLFSPRIGGVLLAAVALLGAVMLTSVLKTGDASSPRTMFGIMTGHVQRFIQERILKPATQGVPMEFPADKNDGFGVCTLASKKSFGKSNFIQYDFVLPQPDDMLSLELGQELELCCLDNNDNVANGKFYVYQPKTTTPTGSFSLLIPNYKKDNTKALGKENANFARVLRQDIKVGDEIALRPGASKLDYRGQYLPVTDIVYICFGVGIVPVLDQVRAVLPTGSSSVSSVTVVWINDETNDFDVNAELLEKEYFKYSDKMAASCIVDNVEALPSLGDSAEIKASIPNFRQGTMAVLSGPSALVQKAKRYLENRGYPSDTVCIL